MKKRTYFILFCCCLIGLAIWGLCGRRHGGHQNVVPVLNTDSLFVDLNKDKVEKPNWKPLEAKNTNMKSDFAKMIEAEEVPEVTPQVIKFGEDVKITGPEEVVEQMRGEARRLAEQYL